jgi:hypothetical protein
MHQNVLFGLVFYSPFSRMRGKNLEGLEGWEQQMGEGMEVRVQSSKRNTFDWEPINVAE